MIDAECIRECYESNSAVYYKRGLVYSIDEKLFKEMDFLKYFCPLEAATRVSMPVTESAKEAVEKKGPGRPKKSDD